MNEVRADPAWSAFLQNDRLAFDPGQTANARTDRTAGAQLEIIIHLIQPGIFQRLTGGIDAENDERIDLALNLVVNAFVRVEPEFVILWLHLARNGAFMIRGVELRDLTCAAFAGDQVCPGCFDITAQRGDKTKSGYNDTAHSILQKQQARPSEGSSLSISRRLPLRTNPQASAAG